MRSLRRPVRTKRPPRSDWTEVDTPPLLQQLRRQPRLLALGFLVAALAAGGRYESLARHFDATTQVAVGETTSLVHSESAKAPDYYTSRLPARSTTLGDMVASPEIRNSVARAASIPASEIAVDAPLWTDLLRDQQWATGEKRASQIVVERDPYRLRLDNAAQGPVIDVSTQAPTAEGATRLAAAVAPAFNDYLARVSAGTPAPFRYDAQQLTPVSVSGASGAKNVATFTFLVTFVLWCGCVLMVTSLVRDLQKARGKPEVEHPRNRSSGTASGSWETRGVWPSTSG